MTDDPPHESPSSQYVDEASVWSLATAMSAAATPLDVARALAEQGAAAAGAVFSNMAIFDAEEGRVRVVHGSMLDPGVAARWANLAITERTPLCAAILSAHPVMLGSLEAISEQYPNMVADTAAASLCSTASLPLCTTSDTPLGAAGFGWSDPQSFDMAQVRRLEVIAHLAAQALDRALLYRREKERQLSEAVTSRAVVDQAKGILMATVGVDADRAFELLKEQSQHENRKLREIAQELVDQQSRQ